MIRGHQPDEGLPIIEETKRLTDLPELLSAWYQLNARELPWRVQGTDKKPDPYHVWVSEIMLQQTRVEAVKRYYTRFMTALPTIGDLAACQEQQLLKLWEGLGYYNRVRNLQKAAQTVMNEYAGHLPETCKELLKLPGFGPYTAGAVASICFQERAAAVDGNVLRVFARLCNDPSDVLHPQTRRKVEQLVKQLLDLPHTNPGLFNQALMELGETICMAGTALLCEECPIRRLCLAKEYGTQGELPVRIKKTKRKIEKKTVLIIMDGRRVAIRRRPDKGLLAGMYELPSLTGTADPGEVLAWLRYHHLQALRVQPLPSAKHLFTHVEWQMSGYKVLVEDQEGSSDRGEIFFVSPDELEKHYPIPGAYAAFASHIDIRIGAERF